MDKMDNVETSCILVVDDNPEIREILRILLTGEGYAVEEAADGVAALRQLQNHTFDLIILDIMMPGMNGYQTCLEIRRTSNAPILFLSAKTKDGDKMLGFSSGGDDYLAKPFSYSELVGRAGALLRRYQVYRGKAEPPDSGRRDAAIRGLASARGGLQRNAERPPCRADRHRIRAAAVVFKTSWKDFFRAAVV